MTARMDQKFADLKAEGRPALVTYFMAGDPDYDTAFEIMKALPGAGADIIELGAPFSDPMAEGPAIQLAGQRRDDANFQAFENLEHVVHVVLQVVLHRLHQGRRV